MLPPYIGTPIDPADRAPWRTDIESVVQRFATTPHRRKILEGWLRHRAGLRAYGFAGFQWLDGSFFDVLPREPGDIDVVAFFVTAPPKDELASLLQLEEVQALLRARMAKKAYLVDFYSINLASDVADIIEMTHYFYGLFSHQRETRRWRGFLRVPLGPDGDEDSAAAQYLAGLAAK